MVSSRRHSKRGTSKSRRSSKNRGIERFLTSPLFKVIGAIFLLIGVYYSFNSMDGTGGFNQMFNNFFKPSENVNNGMNSGESNITMLLFYFLPVILILVSTAILEKRYSIITVPLSIITAFYLIVIQTRIIIYDGGAGNNVYSSLLMADFFLLFTILLLFINVVQNKKPTLLIVTCVYFYLSIVLFTRFGWILAYLFPFVLLFSLAIGYLAHKIDRPIINLLNFIFAIGFFGVFWVRRMVFSDGSEYSTEFLIYGVLFYTVFYGISMYAARAKVQPMRQWMQAVIVGCNLLFYLGTASFVMIHYFSFGYLWLIVLVPLLFNLLGLYLADKYQSTIWIVPHHFVSIVLAALILPVLLHQNMILLFAAGLSILLLIYANKFKNKVATLTSLGAMGIMVAGYLYYWIGSYLPAMIIANEPPESGLLWNGILSGAIVVLTMTITVWLLKDAELPLSKKWFRRSTYNRMIRGALLISLFFALGWIGFSILFQFTGSLNYIPVGWFITGSIFFIGLIKHYSGKQSTFKKPLIYLGFIFVLLYPLLVYWSMTLTLNQLIEVGKLDIVALLLHYLALGLLIILGLMSFWRIYHLNFKKILLQRGVQILVILYLLFLFCSEYNNLSVFILSMQNSHNNGLGIGSEVLEINQYLPYSIIISTLAVSVFIWAIFYRNRFLRSFAVLLYVIALIKIFAYDFENLGTTTRIAIFFILGIFLIGFSFLYPRLLKSESKSKEVKHSIEKTILT